MNKAWVASVVYYDGNEFNVLLVRAAECTELNAERLGLDNDACTIQSVIILPDDTTKMYVTLGEGQEIICLPAQFVDPDWDPAENDWAVRELIDLSEFDGVKTNA